MANYAIYFKVHLFEVFGSFFFKFIGVNVTVLNVLMDNICINHSPKFT